MKDEEREKRRNSKEKKKNKEESEKNKEFLFTKKFALVVVTCDSIIFLFWYLDILIQMLP